MRKPINPFLTLFGFAAACLFVGGLAPLSRAGESPAPPPVPVPAQVPAPAQAPSSAAAPDNPNTPLTTVLVQAPEPRYVAPTLRDRIGRIWAPVYLNGRGPFRLVLDTGASRSAVIPSVADKLGLEAQTGHQVRVRGVSGTAVVPVLRVDRMDIGDLLLEPAMLPVVADVFGGADGVLGNEGLQDKRIVIDFKRDLITVKRSKREPPGDGFRTLPIVLLRGYLLSIDVMIGRVKTKAIIDTGSPQSLGNVALREALKRNPEDIPKAEVVGVTLDVEYADRIHMPTIYMDEIVIRGAIMSFGDVHIFQHWKLTKEPAILLGMDVIGILEQLIIDYRTKQLHIKIHN
jgi:hypothetical protein